MKVILLGGFLGSGKTSLLMSMSKYLAKYFDKKHKNAIAIIENEIGEISIDTQTVNTGGYSVKSLFSGCICCTLTSDLAISVNEIAANEDPEWMIIETTGLAYPDKAADVLRKYCPCCDEIKILVIIDAERWDELTDILELLIIGQVKGADKIIVNKIDLVSEADLKILEKKLFLLNEKAPIYFAAATLGIKDETWDEILERRLE